MDSSEGFELGNDSLDEFHRPLLILLRVGLERLQHKAEGFTLRQLWVIAPALVFGIAVTLLS